MKKNVHVTLAFSPVGDSFRNRLRSSAWLKLHRFFFLLLLLVIRDPVHAAVNTEVAKWFIISDDLSTYLDIF